jgi:hypothetical protein
MKIPIARLLPAFFFLTLPVSALAADVSVDSSTILRFENREVTGSTKQTLLPATQFLGLDVDKLADGNLSLHLYGWGRGDIGDKSYNKDQFDGRLTYGYLQYRFNTANADVRVGRFFVHEGIVNEHIDGASIRTDLPLGFGFSAFGGANVHTQNLYNENSDGKGDGNFGGRLNYRYKGVLELGVSGQYETKTPTLTYYPTVNRRLVGGDVWFSPHKSVELMGHTSYNIETEGVAEQSYLMNIKPLKHLVLTGEYNDHRERNYLYSWTSFSGSALNPNDRAHSLGGSASYEFSKMVEVAVDYKHYTREAGNADRYGADIKLSFLDNSVRGGLGYHYLRAGKEFAITGSGNPNASYHTVRAYALHDTKTYFAAVDVLDYIFKDKVYNEKNAW